MATKRIEGGTKASKTVSLRHSRRSAPSTKSAKVPWRETVEAQASHTPVQEVASYLEGCLGKEVTAYLSGVDSVNVVERWAAGRSKPSGLATVRLRAAFQAAQYVERAFGAEAARSWFAGTNSHLDSRAPASVLRTGSAAEDWGDVLLAAKAFVETGP